MSVSLMYLYKINTLNLEQELSKKEKGINDFLDSKGMKTAKVQYSSSVALQNTSRKTLINSSTKKR